MRIVKNCIKNVQINFNKLKYCNFLPNNPQSSDIFISSFPKSGNTWIRFLIANSIREKYNIIKEVNFFTIQDIIPPITKYNDSLNGPFGIREIPRIFTTHSRRNPFMKRIIYISRNPNDVMISYYRYIKKYNRINSDLTIEEFIESRKYGIDNWISHTESYIKDPKRLFGDERMIHVRYEDFILNPRLSLYNLMCTFGLYLNDSEITNILTLSSRERMSETEKLHLVHRKKALDLNFVRTQKKDGTQYLKDKIKSTIEKKCGSELLSYITKD